MLLVPDRFGWLRVPVPVSYTHLSCPGSSVTAVKAPAGLDSGVIVKEFRSRFGAIIANGQGSMKGQIFRIAHLLSLIHI